MFTTFFNCVSKKITRNPSMAYSIAGVTTTDSVIANTTMANDPMAEKVTFMSPLNSMCPKSDGNIYRLQMISISIVAAVFVTTTTVVVGWRAVSCVCEEDKNRRSDAVPCPHDAHEVLEALLDREFYQSMSTESTMPSTMTGFSEGLRSISSRTPSNLSRPVSSHYSYSHRARIIKSGENSNDIYSPRGPHEPAVLHIAPDSDTTTNQTNLQAIEDDTPDMGSVSSADGESFANHSYTPLDRQGRQEHPAHTIINFTSSSEAALNI